jgi:hypothetical protein
VLDERLGASLAAEAGGADGARGAALRHELEGDDPSGLDIARTEYRTHAASSEQLIDAVAPHHRSLVQQHQGPT